MKRPLVVKVCGLTRREDAAWALECGADWLGFIVHGDSPRLVSAARAGEIVSSLDAPVAVAVMVGVTPERALTLARQARATRVQLHRVPAAAWPDDFPLPCTFAIGVTAAGGFEGEEPAARHLLLLDTSVRGMAGGTGRAFDWNLARPVAARRDVLLAGGLHADNVEQAIRTVRPFGVDASSSLESQPGHKDPDRVRRFVQAARAAGTMSHDA